MSKSERSDCEVTSDGRTVWVGGPDGCCLGRFSRFGVDVHRDTQGQINIGACLDCTTSTDWGRFVSSMRRHHGVVVSDEHKPDYLKTENSSVKRPEEPEAESSEVDRHRTPLR